MNDPQDRLRLPSEDEGDLADEPRTGQTDDYLVAQEEGVPYLAPTERVISGEPGSDGGAEVAGTDHTAAGELEREDAVQPEDSALPRDDELRADVIEALRSSDVVSGDRIRVAVAGSQVFVRGQVESIEVSDEILSLVGDVPGVTDVVDELEVEGI